MSTTKKFGLTSYDEPAQTGGGKRTVSNDEKFEFLRLKPGENRLRIITEPYKYYMVRFKANQDEKGWGKKIRCSAPVEDCPAVKEAGCKAKERWLVGVIDRSDGQVRVFDYHVLAYNKLKVLNDTIEYGDPRGYDVKVNFDPNAQVANQIDVVGLPPTALAEKDLSLKESVMPALVRALERHSAPLKVETVEARMNELGWKGGAVEQVAPTNGVSETLPESDEDDYTFSGPTVQA